MEENKINKIEEVKENDIDIFKNRFIYRINLLNNTIELEKEYEIPSDSDYNDNFSSYSKIVKPSWNTFELEWLLKNNSTHRRCMELKALLVAGFGYDIRNKKHKNYDALESFLKKPNNIFGDTFSKIVINTYRNKISYGYGAFFINKFFDKIQMFASSNTKSIFIIPEEKNGRKTTRIKRYAQLSNGNKKEFFVYDGEPINGRNYIYMIGHKKLSNSYYPEPEYLAIKDKIYEDIFVDKNNIDFFKNRAMGDFIILFSGARLTSNKKEEILDTINDSSSKFKGVGNQHKTMILTSPDKDSTIKIVDLSKNEDGQYSQRQKALENSIARAWGITPSLVLVSQGGSGFGGGSVSIGDLFLENQIMIRPEQHELEEDINILLESLFGFDPQIKFRTIDTNNQKDMSIILNSIISSGTPISKIEARRYIHEHGLIELTNPEVIPEEDDLVIGTSNLSVNSVGDIRSKNNLNIQPDDITSIDENKFNDI